MLDEVNFGEKPRSTNKFTGNLFVERREDGYQPSTGVPDINWVNINCGRMLSVRLIFVMDNDLLTVLNL